MHEGDELIAELGRTAGRSEVFSRTFSTPRIRLY